MPIVTLRPNADHYVTLTKYPTSLSNAYEAVDEETANDDTDYIYANGTSGYGIFELTDPSVSEGEINNVTVKAKIKAVSGTNYYYIYIKVNGTYYNGGQVYYGYSTYTEVSHSWATNPNTGQAWTWTDIQNLIAGVKLAVGNSSSQGRCTQIWVEVDYTLPPQEKSFTAKINLFWRLTNSITAKINLIKGKRLQSKINLFWRLTNSLSSKISLIYRKYTGIPVKINLTEKYLWINGVNLESMGFWISDYTFSKKVDVEEDINGNKTEFSTNQPSYIVIKGILEAPSRVSLDAKVKNFLALVYNEDSYNAVINNTRCTVYPINVDIKEIPNFPRQRELIIIYQVSKEVF